MTQQIYTTPTPFSGTNISIPNSGKGYTSNMVIKGQTYQNLLNRIGAGGNCTINDTTININCTDGTWSLCNIYLNPLLVNSKTYTVILNCISLNTPNGVFEMSGFNNNDWKTGTNIKQGINKFIIKNLDISMIKIQTNTKGNSATIDKNIIILEGDYTNKEVPFEITGIESVGDKENNKISILSQNKNLFNPNNKFISNGGGAKFEMQGTKLIGSYQYKATWVTINIKVDGLKRGHQYSLSCDIIKYHFGTDRIGLYEYATNRRVGLLSKKTITIGNDFDTDDIYFRIHLSDANQDNINDVILDKIQIEENTQVTDYQPHKEDKKEILLPIEGGLKSLSDGTCDTIEQREDGVYLVQRVGKVILDGDASEQWYVDNRVLNNTVIFDKPFTSSENYRGNTMINNKLNLAHDSTANDVENIEIFRNTLYVRLNKSRLSTLDLNGFLKWLNDEPLILYYVLATPIETKLDINNINLQTFKDLTYVISDNNIEPVLKFKAPILGYKTINPIQLKTTQDGTEVNVYPYSTPELITFGDNETLADKMNNIENTHTHNNATVTTDGFMSKESYAKLESLTEYTHPSTHAATMITEDSSHRFVTDTEKNNWNAKASTNVATSSTNGLMSNTDKQKIDRISNNFDIVYDANTETIRFRFR